ncbi:MAG TPA: hypothetical protein VIM14_06340, partial [Polyangia bacterium]
GLGAAFVDAVHDATVMVLEAPKRWSLVPGTRRYLMGKFPFAVVYRETRHRPPRPANSSRRGRMRARPRPRMHIGARGRTGL